MGRVRGLTWGWGGEGWEEGLARSDQLTERGWEDFGDFRIDFKPREGLGEGLVE